MAAIGFEPRPMAKTHERSIRLFSSEQALGVMVA